MKETEIYQQTYIAFPIKESPLFDYLKKLNSRKKFPHFTLYFLNNLTDENLQEVKRSILSKPDIFANISLSAEKLDTIGIHDKTFALRIKITPELAQIRDHFESSIPNYLDANLPFIPHISIKKKFDRRDLFKITDLSLNIPAYLHTSLGVYYRTEENATALLFSHKI